MIELKCDAVWRCNDAVLNLGADERGELRTDGAYCKRVNGHRNVVPSTMMSFDGELNPLLRGNNAAPLMLVISGPSGVGKDALVARLRELDEPFHFVVTATSRPPRPSERDGVDYFFYDTPGFEQLIATNELVEWAEVYGHYKGIPKHSIRTGLQSGRNVILRIDVQGAATLKRLLPGAIQVFLAPGNMQELSERLQGRGTESADQFERRMSQAEREMAQVTAFDYVVFNRAEQLDAAVAQIRAILMAEQQRVRPRKIAL